jgi:hypothetical protein
MIDLPCNRLIVITLLALALLVAEIVILYWIS